MDEVVTSSWWIGLSRHDFYVRLAQVEERRLRELTHDPKLSPRGKTETSGQGRASGTDG